MCVIVLDASFAVGQIQVKKHCDVTCVDDAFLFRQDGKSVASLFHLQNAQHRYQDLVNWYYSSFYHARGGRKSCREHTQNIKTNQKLCKLSRGATRPLYSSYKAQKTSRHI